MNKETKETDKTKTILDTVMDYLNEISNWPSKEWLIPAFTSNIRASLQIDGISVYNETLQRLIETIYALELGL